MPEVFDIVDEDDRVVGRATRGQVHGDPSLIHRVVHVLVFNSRGELFLQLRAPDKDVQPDRWDTSVGGHVDAGEGYREAAVRELREELGIRIDPDDHGPHARLEPLYHYLHRNAYESEMVCTYRLVWDGPVKTDPAEIAGGRFWTLAEVDTSDPTLFTANFLDEVARYRAWLRGPAG